MCHSHGSTLRLNERPTSKGARITPHLASSPLESIKELPENETYIHSLINLAEHELGVRSITR
jgi:hypothetical protein